MRVEESIREKLRGAFAPAELEVVNDSHHHAGHRSSPGTGESHFSVNVVSAAFAGKSRLERHRMVNAALAEELAGRVHALASHRAHAGRAGQGVISSRGLALRAFRLAGGVSGVTRSEVMRFRCRRSTSKRKP